jgi:hypothetical protein
MSIARIMAANGARLVPLDGGPVIIPPTPGGGGPATGPKTAMLIGAASGVLNGADFAALDAAAGPFTCRRSYDTVLPATFADSVAGIDVGQRASIWSCKPDLAQLAAGLLDTQIRSFVASIPPSHVAFLTAWHEPDAKIRKGQFTLSDYLPAFVRWCQVVKQAAADLGRPYVYTAQIMTTWSGQHPQTGTTFEDLWPGDGLVDVYAVDGYSNVGSGDALWGPAVAFATSKNIPWAVAETGCVDTMDTTWMATQATYAASHRAGGGHTKAAFFCWFSNTTGGVLATPGNDPAAQATAHAVAVANYTDVNAFVL